MVEGRAESDDETLMLEICEGGHEAFAELVRRHGHRFYRIAYRLLFNKNDAEDVVQEAFLRLWERPYMWNSKKRTKFTTWFYRVVINLCLDHNRKKRPFPLSDNMEITNTGPGVEESLQAAQQKALLDRCIGELPERQQLALNLCFYEGLSNSEAADILGIKVKALQSLLMRAKTTLKEKVQNYTKRGVVP